MFRETKIVKIVEFYVNCSKNSMFKKKYCLK